MHNFAKVGIATALLGLVAVAGVGVYRDWHPPAASTTAAGLSATALWQAQLKDVDGKNVALAQFQGKPAIINFWATWCEPCREEMPEISALASEHPEWVVLGLAIDDAQAVHDFTGATPVSYPILIAENEGMALLDALGDQKGVLPYTVVLSADGRVLQTFFGRVTRKMLEKALNMQATSA